MNIAIIGCGASGLICASILKDNGFNITIFEKSSYIGGVWCYSKEGVIYDNLVTNLPKTIMQFSNKYPFKGYSNDSFVSYKEVFNYLETFYKDNELNKFVKFNSEVKKLYKKDERWTIEYDFCGNKLTNRYDSVIVCNGHYEKASNPTIKGVNLFKGEVFHSAKYDSHLNYKFVNKNIAVIGKGPSASDVARLIKNFSNCVYVIDRSLNPNEEGYKSEDNKIIQVCNLDKITGENELNLVNNKKIYVDYIICATGYEYDIPFLDEYISYSDGMVKPLYQHLFYARDPTLCFVGLPHPVIPFFMSFLQSKWIVSVLKNKNLPKETERMKWIKKYEDNLIKNKISNKKYHNMQTTQFEYYRMIAREANILDNEFSKYIDETEIIYKKNLEEMPKYPGCDDNFRKIIYKRNI